MASFLDRYLRGEHERVWDELVGLGADVRRDPLVGDAWAVARETMRRAGENVRRIVERLPQVGYAFAYESERRSRVGSWWGDSYPVYEPPGADAAERLDALERGTGAMPLSLRAWYQVVGTVNLIGSHPEWPETEVLDSLVVAPLGETLEGIERDYREWREDQGGDVEWAADELEGPKTVPFRWDFAPDALHKANINGGAPYGVEFPCPCADARVWFEPHDMTFVNYLRECLRWGGFPGFAQVPASERPGDDLALLTDGLDPF